ncbi:ABC transporter permease [Dongia sedimenti]|uniref:ABC transporter permease n=1 Tax=Dongia sedimenti TaxID=3064282 RepID=A0ABU0YUT6_9PROT|nr:ABC transporter permease [Rhodospirillaceae bacterium R-7]
MEWFTTVLYLLGATIRVSTPLIFCAMAGLISERSGVIDIGLEGKMLAAAFAAAVVAALTGSAWDGLAAAVLVGAMLSLLHGFACITHRGDQVVSGVAINIIVSGLTVVLGNAWFQRGGETPQLQAEQRFMGVIFPGTDNISHLPLLGPLYVKVLSGQSLLTYIAFLLVPAVAWLLYRSRFGLRLRAVGENPAVVDTAGISVDFLRYRAVVLGGILCGFAGAYLAIAQNAGFQRDMTAGRGYIALAAMIFGKWKPLPALYACLLFGFLDAGAPLLQGVKIYGNTELPVQLIQALPYALTVILLAGFIGKAIPPKAIGRPYIKER